MVAVFVCSSETTCLCAVVLDEETDRQVHSKCEDVVAL